MPAIDTVLKARDLVARATYCRDRYGRVYQCNSSWYNWGRWVAVGVIIAAALVLFFLCSTPTTQGRPQAILRYRLGSHGWPGAVQSQLSEHSATQLWLPGNNMPNNNTSAPPTYGQQGGYYGGQQNTGAAQDYYSGNRGGDYAPPAGPPPAKH
ncbi:uncharacterized protein AB675_5107 [Cyphellophora attinorum]|uniref:Protein RCR2 n=1 Tax=Cyphellophora attinorum TaxID=1664694 RepID=A0A0N1H843_9EURO|nr:uncharacterized protein AB675_5107 [Phialophora attinorum]KPI39410.1 hypothetical protein AB675_5107 [Phialophora attinorum]